MTEVEREDYRYSIIPGAAVTDDRLSGRDLQVLALLGRHTNRKGWCRRSQVEMAKELHCGRATVFRSMKRLLETDYVERLATGRGKAAPDPDKQPFSAFWYRVKIDRDDDGDIIEWEVPKNGHAPVAKAKTYPKVPILGGHQVPTESGQEVPTSAGTLNRTTFSEGPISNSLAPAGAGENETVLPFRKEEADQFHDFMDTIAEHWPQAFPATDLAAAVAQFERRTTVHSAAALITAARLHGAWLWGQKANRGTGPFLQKRPSNWLKERGYEGYLQEIGGVERRKAETSKGLDAIAATLGLGVVENLRRCGISDDELLRFDGVTFEAGPPPCFTAARAFQASRLRERGVKLQKAFGEGLQIIEVSQRRSA